jgi:N-acetyl-anhydromuramyl-L-alanine amidase AmpD
MSGIQFIKARHFTPGRKVPISLLVIHDMEAARSMVTALHVAQWFAGPAAPQASAHFCVDSSEAVQCVAEFDTAWAAPGANDQGIHYELAGFAKDTREQWLTDAHELELAASLVAMHCAAYGIPAEFVDADCLAAGKSGITTHAEVSKWKKTIGGHTDPGPGFPMDRFVEMVRAELPPTCTPSEL